LASSWQIEKSKKVESSVKLVDLLISIEKLSHSINDKQILKSIDLQINSGEILALMGRNGAGKSTLLKVISGQISNFTGQVKVDDKNPSKLDGSELVNLIGFIPQEPSDLFYGNTVKQECEMADRDNKLLVGTTVKTLHKLSDQISLELHPRDLSEGQKLILAISIVLATNPKILILDEPTRGLDYQAKDTLVKILRNLSIKGTTIIMATHDVELVAEFASRVLVLAEGELISDGPTIDVLTASPAFAPQMAKVFSNQSWLTVNDVISSDIDFKGKYA
jgi:energy-coupling factor transport system ATP-binding protein